MEQPTAVSNILQSDFRPDGNLQGIAFEVIANQIRLEQGAHLSVAGPRMVQDHEVNFERCHENEDREDDKTRYTSTPVFQLISLKTSVTKYWRKHSFGRTTGIFRSPNLSQRSSIVYNPTSAVTKRPTILTDVTHPIERPVIVSHSHQSKENGLTTD